MGYVLTSRTARKMKRWAASIAMTLGVALAATTASAITIEDHAKRIIRGEIAKCFEPPPGVEPPYPSVELLMKFNARGALSGPPQIVSSLDSKSASLVALRVVTAASRCATLKVLAGLGREYNQWKTIRILIEPKPGIFKK